MSTRSFALAAACVLLAVLSVAVPAAAAPRTWYVAPTGSGGGSCAHPDKHSIQSAIDAARVGDTILVCDGTYTEALAIKGAAKDRLQVQAVHAGKAVVKAPPPGPKFSEFIPALVAIDSADNTTFSGFTLAARGSAPCLPVNAMVEITGTSTNTSVANNRMIVQGNDTDFNDPCGYGDGIAHFIGAPTAFIDSNVIIDFGDSGITSDAPGPKITNNTLVFKHTDMASGSAYDGIAVTESTNVVITGNDIESPATAGSTTPVLTNGIRIRKATSPRITGNTVRNTVTGISASTLNGGRIRGNTVRSSDGDGILLMGSKGMSVSGNSSLGSGKFDCDQLNSTGVNTWTDNIGRTSRPFGICTPP
jgi:parallel beta-helix repeat protein